MTLSKKTDYALRALVSVSAPDSRGPVSIRELARRNDVPRRYLEQVMLDLKSQGWVRSVRGRDGGYILAREPKEVSMGEIVRYFDGVLAPIGCVSVKAHEPCSQEPTCRFRHVLLQIRNYTADLMDQTTLADLEGGGGRVAWEAPPRRDGGGAPAPIDCHRGAE